LKALMLCAALMLAGGQAWGGSEIDDLKYPPLNKFDIPEPDRYVLDNGMTVYLLEDHTLPKINLSATINRCGSYLEPATKIGLAEIAGNVMRTGGTTSKTGDQIDAELEAIGAFVETNIGSVSGSAGANSLSEYKETIIATLADVLRNPVFDQDKIDLAKNTFRSAISRRNDEPMDILVREFRKVIFGAESPYARQEEYATIEAISQDDLKAFHKKFVQPNNIQIAVWGDFDSQEMLNLIKDHFGDWAQGTVEIPAPPEVEYAFSPSVNYAEKEDVNQSSILVGHLGGMMGDPDYAATIVMNAVLGGSFGSRLTDNVRTKMGLAYSAEGRFSFGYDYPGWFYAFAATKLESTVKAIREINRVIASMQTDPPTEDEMIRAKNGWLNSLVFRFDTKGEVINRMMTYDYYGLPRDYLQQLKEQVENVTPEDVVEVAKRKLHPEALNILVVGKADDFDEPLSVFGEVNDLDITIPAPASEAFAADPEEMAEGLALIRKAAEACGGVEAFKNIETITSVANVAFNTPQGAFNMEATSVTIVPDRSAQVIKTPMGDQTVVIDGETGWMIAGGQTQVLPASQLEDEKKGKVREMLWLFSHCDQDDFIMVASKGEEQFNDVAALRLDFLADDGTQFTMYIDPTTHYPIGTRFMGETMAGPGEIVITMGDYVEYGGVMMPSTRLRDMGEMTMEIEVVSVEINGSYDESLFVKPEGI
jgi:predicted Zn-dependent peptidase